MRSPEEFRHIELRRRLRGYDRAEVEQLLTEILDNFGAVWNERTKLFDEVIDLRGQLAAGEAALDSLTNELERARADETIDERERPRPSASGGSAADAQRPEREAEPPSGASTDARTSGAEAERLPDGPPREEPPLSDSANGVRRPLRDMPLTELRDYVMQRFELHHGAVQDKPEQTETS